MIKAIKVTSFEDLKKMINVNDTTKSYILVAVIHKNGKGEEFIFAEINTKDRTPIMDKLNELTKEV